MSVLVELAVAVVVSVAIGNIIESTINWYTQENPLTPTSEEVNIALNEIIDEELLSEGDKKMAADSRACIHRIFGETVSSAVISMKAKQRVEASTRLITELCELYHISLQVEYYSEASGDFGGYSYNENKIKLNIAYLMTDDPACILEYFDSVIHELRHAVQFSVFKGNSHWQIVEKNQMSWFENIYPPHNYVLPKQDGRGYIMQPIERDAFTFAHHTLKGVC